MSIVDADTGEIVHSAALATPDIARPGEPISLARITSQCRSIEVWSEHCNSIPDIQDARNKLAAIEQYVASTSKDGRALIAAAQRRLEIRIGILLGPTKVGERHDLAPSLASEGDADLTANERSQFRKMADHPEVVEAVIDDSDDETPASRRRTLDEINRTKHQPPAEPTADEIRGRTKVLAAKELYKAGQFFAMFTPQQIHDLNDPDISEGVRLVLHVVKGWGETYEETKPTGLVVHQGGKP